MGDDERDAIKLFDPAIPSLNADQWALAVLGYGLKRFVPIEELIERFGTMEEI